MNGRTESLFPLPLVGRVGVGANGAPNPTRRATLAGAGSLLLMAGIDPLIQLAMRTPMGTLTLALRPARAPVSCAAFLACVDAHFYDGGRFTRVVRPDNDRRTPPINLVQGAAAVDPDRQPKIAHEPTSQTGLKHLDGAISLPRDAPGTATGAEFFICVGDVPGLDYGGARNPDGQGYAVFGRVVSGMEIVRAIWRMDASGPSKEKVTAGQMLLRPYPILGVDRVP